MAENEAAARKALLDACVKAKKCTNAAELRGIIPELLQCKDALQALQKPEREKESAKLSEMKPDLEAFTTWLKQNGEYSGSAIEFRSAGDAKGNGVFVKKDKHVRKDDLAMLVPLSVCLYAQFNGSSGGVQLPPVVRQNAIVKTLPSLELAIALLLEVKLGKESFFSPYLAILPRSLDTLPLNWNAQEMNLIQDDSCLALIVSRLRDIALAYCMMSDNPELRRILGTFEQFIWAVGVVNSRQNPLPAPPGGGAPKVVLIPAFDMCNHDPNGGKISTEFSWANKIFECRAHKSFEGGEEFTIYYGPRPDVELLLYSGFVALPPGINQNTALIQPFNLKIDDVPEIAKGKKVLVDKVPGISPTGNESFYLLSLGGALGDSALRIFSRAAAAKTKDHIQAALKKKLETPTASLSDPEKDYVRTSIASLKANFTSVTPGAECRPHVIKVADDYRLSCLAVLERIEKQLTSQ